MNDGPEVVIGGILELLERDLEKHGILLERTKLELLSYREARSHEVKKKKHYKSLIGGGKYNDVSLKNSMNEIAINIRHFSDKCELAEREIKHHQLIIDTLTGQVKDEKKALAQLEQYYKEHPEERPDANSS